MKRRVKRAKSSDDGGGNNATEESSGKRQKLESPEDEDVIVEKEEEVKQPKANTAVDITRKWLVSKLSIEAVSNLVMVSMVCKIVYL